MAWHSSKPSCPNWGWEDSRGGEGAGGSEEVLFLNSHHGSGGPDNDILTALPAAKPTAARDALSQQPQQNPSWILHQAHGPSLYVGNGGDGHDTEVCNGHGLDAGINAAFAAASPSTTLAVGGHGDPSGNLPFWDYGASHGSSKDWSAGSKIGILDFKHDSAHGVVASEHDVVDAKENGLKEGDIEFLKLRSHHGSSSLGQWKPVSTGTQQQGSPIVEEVNGKQGLPFLPHAGACHDTSATQSSEEQHSSTATGSAGSGDSLTGLHLGKRNHDGDATVSTVPRRVQNPAQSNPVPLKKQRASSVALQTPRCQVQGCNLELTNAKAYHKRHKVCDAHSKAEKVVVANLEQRFCQQCSRFHVLAEFDEVKRSCRKRLAGHNERRRKPQPEALALNARFSSIFRDWPFYPQSRLTGMSSLWGDPGESSSLFFRGSWPKTLKLEDQQGHNWAMQPSGMEKEMFYTGSSPHFGEKSPLLLLHSPKGMMSMPNESQGQRFLQYLPRSFGHGADGSTLSSSSGAGALSSLEAAPATQAVTRVTDSGCALSLLSVQTQGSHVADAVSLGLSTGASLPVDSSMNDNILSIAFNSRKDLGGGSNGGMEKDQMVNSFIHGFNGVGCLQSLPLYPTLRGQETKVLQASRPAVEVMQIMPLSQPYGQAMGFQMPFGDLPYSDESSLMELQQRI